MTNFQSFNSHNGWMMPGSGEFFIDECGDLWVPCLCGRCNGDGIAAGSETIESVESPQTDADESDFVTIRVPKAWLRDEGKEASEA